MSGKEGILRATSPALAKIKRSSSPFTGVSEITNNDGADIPTIILSEGEEDSSPTMQTTVAKRKTFVGPMCKKERYRLKRRKINVNGAPKMPLTGYVRFMNERREVLRKEMPTRTAIEHTKIIGEEWSQLPEDRKAPYMRAAQMDKEKYLHELDTFLQGHPDVLALELEKNKFRKLPTEPGKSGHKEKMQSNGSQGKSAKEFNRERARGSSDADVMSYLQSLPQSQAADKHTVRKRTPTPIPSTGVSQIVIIPGEIPIFTQEFLEHNRLLDMELRSLRKTKSDLEQHVSVLERHVENMRFGIGKLRSENEDIQEMNKMLELYLEKLKKKLVNALSNQPIPTEPNGANMDNIYKYVHDVYKAVTTNTHGPASLNKAKEIIRKLDVQVEF